MCLCRTCYNGGPDLGWASKVVSVIKKLAHLRCIKLGIEYFYHLHYSSSV